MSVSIDPEFAGLIHAPSSDELRGLEADIVARGCLDAIKTWNGLIVDGHNRFEICKRLGKPYRVEALSFGTRDEAKAWMIAHQLGRRNLPENVIAYYRGQYKALLQDIAKASLASRGPAAKVFAAQETEMVQGNEPSVRYPAPFIAGSERLQVTAKTERENAHYARAVDEVAKATGVAPVAIASIPGLTQKATQQLAESLDSPNERVREQARNAVTEMVAGEEPAQAMKRAHAMYNTGDNEWYTPSNLIDCARSFLGAIDLDPASSALANETVRAMTWYGVEQDGLAQRWHGRVWMNPPYARGLIERFVERLMESHLAGDVPEALILVNNATDTRWFHHLQSAPDRHTLALSYRVKFLSPEGRDPNAMQGQVVVYLGSRRAEFALAFSAHGVVL
jgi:ParB family chromosome partitioning protein